MNDGNLAVTECSEEDEASVQFELGVGPDLSTGPSDIEVGDGAE